MPNLIGDKDNHCVPCEPSRDSSIYLHDGHILYDAVDMKKISKRIREQLDVVYRSASNADVTMEELSTAVEKLQGIIQVYARLERFKEDHK